MSTIYRGMTGDVTFREADKWTPRLVPLADVLPRLSMSRSNAYKLIAKGQFPVPVIRVGGRWYARSVDVDELTHPT